MKDLKSLIAELREKANAATPGPWEKDWSDDSRGNRSVLLRAAPEQVVSVPVVGSRSWKPIVAECFTDADLPVWENAEFIAACDPQTILRLCDEIEKLEKELNAWVPQGPLPPK